MATTASASLIGGAVLALSVHSLAVLNGSLLGCSGFAHRAFAPDGSQKTREAGLGAVGLVLGGVMGALLGRNIPALPFAAGGLLEPQLWLSGFLVGLGSKLQNGCTSGHFLAGVARGSPRSITASVIFTLVAMLTTLSVTKQSTAIGSRPLNWQLNNVDQSLILVQALPIGLYLAGSSIKNQQIRTVRGTEGRMRFLSKRSLAPLCTSMSFSLGLLLSNMNDPLRVVNFLVTPISNYFDSSLLFLAAGALPLLSILSRRHNDDTKPINGGDRSITSKEASANVTGRLLIGAVLFGIGWGLSGICPGPCLTNLGYSLAAGVWPEAIHYAAWLLAMVVGGRLVPSEKVVEKRSVHE